MISVVLVPEADGSRRTSAAHRAPRRGVAPVMLKGATHVDVGDEVARHAGGDLHHLRRDDDVVRIDLRLGGHRIEAAHEAFGPAVLRRPLRGGVHAFLVQQLHHALLVLGCQQRKDGRNLVDAHAAVPVLAAEAIATGPVPGHGGIGVLRRAAMRLRFSEQCFVVRLRSLERIRTDDGRARIVAIAEPPRAPCSAGPQVRRRWAPRWPSAP